MKAEEVRLKLAMQSAMPRECPMCRKKRVISVFYTICDQCHYERTMHIEEVSK